MGIPGVFLMPRREQRDGFDDPTRIKLLENDLDANDVMMQQGAQALRETVSEFRAELKAMRGLLIGILVSVTTAALLLAANMVVGQ